MTAPHTPGAAAAVMDAIMAEMVKRRVEAWDAALGRDAPVSVRVMEAMKLKEQEGWK
jgi:hypothetical protein